jgi:NAD(P)-dependent dehydrogenase (short-subunit alcohol dehydrogenase family)
VVALTEALYLDLAAEGICTIGVTLVMPGVVQSKIMFPEKTGPEALQGELGARLQNRTLGALEHFMRGAVDGGLPADDLADMVFGAIANGDLYVLPNFTDEAYRASALAIAQGRAMGVNAYPPILEGLLQALGQ